MEAQWTERALEIVTNVAPNVVFAIALLVVGFVAAKMIRGTVRRVMRRSSIDDTLIPFVSGLVYYLVIAFVVLAVLARFGIQTTSIVALLGALGFAIGLAMQGTLSNFASGVMLLVFRPFGVGDAVEAGGETGKVIEIGIFSTTLHTPDNVKIILPNSAIYGSTIKNVSANDTRRNDLVVGIDYGDDIDKAIGVIERMLEDDPRVLSDPAPLVAVGELGDSSVNLLVRPWCAAADYWPLRFDLTKRLKEELEAAGCSLPFPQRDVHLHQP